MYHAVEAIALQVWPGRLAQVTVLRAVVTNLMSGDGGRYNRAHGSTSPTFENPQGKSSGLQQWQTSGRNLRKGISSVDSAAA